MMTAKAIKTTIGAAAAALALLLAACAGGSGSSGFLTEAAVIQDVLASGECMDLDGLEICPAGVAPTPTPTAGEAQPTDTPADAATPEPTDTHTAPQQTATPQPTGDFGTPTTTPNRTAVPTDIPTAAATASPTATALPLGSVDVVPMPEFTADCAVFAFAGPCLVVQLQPNGFPPAAVFHLASRPADSDGPWTLTATALDSEIPQGSAPLTAAVPLPADIGMDGGGTSSLQIVVLAFLDQPSAVPATVDRLADSGADQAFVLDPLFF
jgi:hypothetical protein